MKIGVGIITCDRPEFFTKCRDSIKDDTFDHIVVSLQEICGHNYLQAVQCAHLVHHKGECEIFVDKCSLTESIFEELQHQGLIVDLQK